MISKVTDEFSLSAFFQQTGPEDYGTAVFVQKGYLLGGFCEYKLRKRTSAVMSLHKIFKNKI